MSKGNAVKDPESTEKEEAKQAAANVNVKLKIDLPGVSRSLSAADFTSVGVSGQGKVNVKSGETIAVSREAADYLCNTLGEFEEVKPGQKVGAPDELATDIVDTVPEGVEDRPAGSSTGANVRDGAGSTSPGANINR